MNKKSNSESLTKKGRKLKYTFCSPYLDSEKVELTTDNLEDVLECRGELWNRFYGCSPPNADDIKDPYANLDIVPPK